MKKHILIICPYPENEVPGQRLKYEQYFEYFRSKGYRITVTPFFGESYYKILYTPRNYHKKILGTLWGYLKRTLQILRLPFYDGIYVFLYVTPFGGPFFERLYRLFSRKMIYDIDDLVFLGRASKFNPMVAQFRKPEKYFFLMKEADHVITCTPYLDSIVRKYNSRTTDISSTINTDKYIPIENYSNDHKLTLGWSGSHSTVPYLRILEPVLRKLKKEYDFKLLVIDTSRSIFKIEGIDVEKIQWNESTEVDDLRRIDIGLYPLPDEEWVLGKSGLKALQYMALGIPTLATAIGTNFRIIENDVSGFLVNSEDEWLMQLGNLMSDPDLRSRIGKNGRNHVQKYYSVRANEPVYLSIFEDVFNNNEITIEEPITPGLDQLPISVVIPIYNDKKSFENVFDAVCKQTKRPKQIVIIDSSDDDDIGINLHKYNDNIEIEYKKVERSFPGRARNLGAQIASEKYLAFLDSKTVPKKNWLSGSFAMLKDYDVILGSVIYKGASSFKKLISVAIYGKNSVESISGALMLKSVFLKIGFFHEKARAGEDIDWRIRAKESEFNYYLPAKENTVYSEISSNLIFHIKRSFVYQMHGARLDIQHSTKVVFLSLFLILLASLVPIWNDIVGHDHDVFFVPHIIKIFLLFLGLFVFFSFIYYKLFLTNFRKRRSLKFLINFSLFIWISIVVYNWNERVGLNSPFFVPYLTKYYLAGLLSSSIILRGIILPIKRGVHNNYLFPYRWAGIGLIGLTLDISKAPGYLLGSLVVIYIKIKSQFKVGKKE